jgi:hypothetical protein
MDGFLQLYRVDKFHVYPLLNKFRKASSATKDVLAVSARTENLGGHRIRYSAIIRSYGRPRGHRIRYRDANRRKRAHSDGITDPVSVK